jgi:hypothetical protein
MTSQRTPHEQPAQTAGGSPAAVPVPERGTRRNLIHCFVLALVPVAVFVAIVVLAAMAASSAAATGGCGGG